MLCGPLAGTVHAMARTTTASFQWSELGRRSGEVGDALDAYGEVTVVRGSQLLRLAVPTERSIMDTLREMCRVLTVLVKDDDSTHVTKILNVAWPWTRALPEIDQIAFAREVGSVAEVCESLNSWRQLIDLVADWRRTARAWADGEASLVRVETPIEALATRPT